MPSLGEGRAERGSLPDHSSFDRTADRGGFAIHDPAKPSMWLAIDMDAGGVHRKRGRGWDAEANRIGGRHADRRRDGPGLQHAHHGPQPRFEAVLPLAEIEPQAGPAGAPDTSWPRSGRPKCASALLLPHSFGLLALRLYTAQSAASPPSKRNAHILT